MPAGTELGLPSTPGGDGSTVENSQDPHAGTIAGGDPSNVPAKVTLVTVHDILAILRQRWRLILATLFVAVSVAALVTLTTPRTYEASTRVYLLAEGEQANLYQMPGGELQTIIQVATSPVVMDPVRDQVGVAADAALTVTAAVADETTLLDVTVEADDPQVAAQVAAAVPQQLAAVARDYSPMLANSGQTVEAQTIVPAVVPSEPTSPNALRNLALGALAGLMLGIGFALLRHNLDTRIRDPKDVEQLSDRPVLASVPARRADSKHLMFFESEPFSSQSEALRRLRTNLMFVDVTTRKHSFVVTSALPAEGKTTTAVNLAMAMADAGTKVLLIDGDLRHPSVADAMGLEGSVGLTTVLLGRADHSEMIQRWAGSNLYVLPAGEIPPNPSELLGSDAMMELFERLVAEFDFILVDTPPILPVADALVLERLTGGALLVVAAGSTRRHHLTEALHAFETADATVAGFALTKTPVEPEHYYGYYRTGPAPQENTRAARRRSAAERRDGYADDQRVAAQEATRARVDRLGTTDDRRPSTSTRSRPA
jgi:succinoglycan biosynthesis transport protein ExoP